jgi:hypothetical protein
MPAIGTERAFVIVVGALFIAALVVARLFHTVSLKETLVLGGVTLIVVAIVYWLLGAPDRGENRR